MGERHKGRARESGGGLDAMLHCSTVRWFAVHNAPGRRVPWHAAVVSYGTRNRADLAIASDSG